MAEPQTGTETIDAYVRCARVLDVLWGQMATGLSPSEVAAAAAEPKSYISRALRTLAAAGHVEQVAETGRWRPSVRLARRATEVHRALARAGSRIDELQARIGPLTESGRN
jgi:DNA-binding IclR family transcriptional regulator